MKEMKFITMVGVMLIGIALLYVAYANTGNMSPMSGLNTMSGMTTTSSSSSDGFSERGFYITLDTADGGLSPTGHTNGPVVYGTNTASIQLGPIPKDIPPNPSPTGTAIYVIATFHTHTPTVNWPDNLVRGVGPSEDDKAFAIAHQLPGLVYDYIADPLVSAEQGEDVIPGGHPLDASAKVYIVEGEVNGEQVPTRRPTP